MGRGGRVAPRVPREGPELNGKKERKKRENKEKKKKKKREKGIKNRKK